jgi:hypothetical protein
MASQVYLNSLKNTGYRAWCVNTHYFITDVRYNVNTRNSFLLGSTMYLYIINCVNR